MADTKPAGGQRRGLQAQEGSNRQEYRKFRGGRRPPQRDLNQPQLESLPEMPKSPKRRPQNKVRQDVRSVVKLLVNSVVAAENGVVSNKSRQRRVCRYFQTPGGCALGDDCQFRHVLKSQNIENVEHVKKQNIALSERKTFVLPSQLKVKLPLEKLGSEEAAQMRNTELRYFRTRYVRSKFTQSETSTSIEFEFVPTDPDWGFAVKSVVFTVILPTDYPFNPAQFNVDKIKNNGMPDILCAHVETTINAQSQFEYSVMKINNAFESYGKTLLRWMDKNMFSMFLEGLRKTKLVLDANAAGIKLVYSGGAKLGPRVITEEIDDMARGVEDCEVNCSSSEEENDQYIGVEESDKSDEDGNGEVNMSAAPKPDVDVRELPRYPIELVMSWNDTSKNIATLNATQLQIFVKCGRCGEPCELNASTTDKPVLKRCSRCQMAFSLRLRSELVHEHSNVLAQVQVKGCKPVDCVLQNSTLKFACLACNRVEEAHKINYGEAHKSWCRSCHTLCSFIITILRFIGHSDGISKQDHEAARLLHIPKKKKPESNVSITPGQPLPNLGACVHFKKSYRWFRFPCCGKVYPCDECHSEREKEHEAKLANRMICGHCSTEQPFTKSKPCTNCSQNVTRSKSQFWEGGKGCRDQKVMNRNDPHKHTDGRKKTVSKKKTGLLAAKAKPKTAQ